ncbi:hypothetical protein M3148_02650 [Georgenia satyanarayanai]|uniref:hypothetical protein n=1 Tax=Georgenia satyanarayanai TaxID=860221 RepID=UPI00203E5E00|nr:hypothetical protein [Georgenia satyanarayanai]MCM3659900.1 hypothetical protein [Georgenia satyanarayanai]
MDVVAWLLDSDPGLRWQVLADLTDAPQGEVAAERARVATTGWGAQLLAEQADDGRWDGGTYRPGWVDESRPFFDAWTATHFALQQLADLGLDPHSPQAAHALALVREHVRWEHEGEPFFDGEVEPCIDGVALRTAAYFEQDASPMVSTLLAGRLPDGGWNCWAEHGASVSSFHSTVCVVEGLLAWQRAGHDDADVRAARHSGEEYLLDRGLFRRRSDGTVADPRMTMLSYPVRWYHDVLRGLEHFRLADRRDPRLAEAVELVRGKADERGLWTLELHHEGPTLLDLGESEGFPSRWVTLRALRVLRWWDAA